MLISIPCGLCYGVLAPTVSYLPRGPSKILSRSSPGSWRRCSVWIPMHVAPCVLPPRAQRLFPSAQQSSFIQALLNFTAKCSGVLALNF